MLNRLFHSWLYSFKQTQPVLVLYLLPLVAIVLRFASAPAAGLSYMLLALYALFSIPNAIQALVLAWFFNSLNPALAPSALLAIIGLNFVKFSSAFCVFYRVSLVKMNPKIHKLTLFTLFIGFLLLVHSYFISRYSMVSILKVTLWLVIMLTVISAWKNISREQNKALFKQYIGFVIFIMMLSLPFMFTGLGYVRNGTGFQGVLEQPQEWGPFIAIFVTGALICILHQVPENRLFSILVLFLGVAYIFASESRTAGFASLLGIGSSVMILYILYKQPIRALFPALNKQSYVMGIMLLILLFIMLTIFDSGLSDLIQNYIAKRGDSSGLIGVYESSRGVLIQPMLNNIYHHPFSGIGFGIASDPGSMEVFRDPFLGLPISAPVEKGVTPIALLEEVGILVYLIIAGWFVCLAKEAAKRGVLPLSVLMTAIFLNLGEATFFSTNGFGLLLLVIVGWTLSYES